MIHTSLVSSIVILLWRMIWFIPTSRILSPPAVPKYNMQSIYSVHPQVRLRSFWSQAVSAIKWSLQHLCNLFKQPTEKSGFFFKLLSLLIKDSTGPVVNVFTTVSSARQTDADQQAGPLLDQRGQVSCKTGSHPPAAGMLFLKNSRPLSMLLWFISF